MNNNSSQYKLDHVDLKLRTVTPEESPLQLHRLTNPIDVTMQVNANNNNGSSSSSSSNNGELYSIEVRLEKLMNHQWIDCNPNPTKGNEIRPLFKDISIQMTVNNGLKSRVIIPSHVSPKDGQFLYFQIPAMPSSSSPTTTTTTTAATTTNNNNINNNARHNLTFELVIKMNTSKEKQGYKRGQDAIFRFSFQLMKHDTRTSMMTRVNQVNSFHFGIINHGKTNKAAKMYAGKGTSSTNTTTTTNDNSSNLLSASPLSSSSSPSPSPSPLHQQQYLTSGGQLRKSTSNTSMTSTTPTNASHNQDASPTGSISSPIHYNINSSSSNYNNNNNNNNINMNVSGQSPIMYQQLQPQQQVNQSSSPSNAFSSLCDLDPVSLMTFLQSNPQFQQQLMEFANEKNGYKDLAESIKLLTVFDQRQQQQQQQQQKQQNGSSVFFQSMNNNNANNGSQVSPCPSSASSFASSGSSTDSTGEILKFEDLFSSGGVNGDLDWNMDDIDCFDSMMEEGDLLGSDDILTLADDFKLDEIFSVPRGSDQQQKQQQQQQQLQQQQMQQLQFQQQQQMAWYAQQQQAMLMQQQQQNMMGLTGQQQQQTMSGGFYDLLTNNSQNVMLNGFATVQQQQQYLQAMQQQQLLLAQQQQQMQWNNPNAFIPQQQQQQQQQRQAGVQYVPNTRNMYNAHMSMSSYEEEEEDEMIKSDLIMAPSRTRTIAINAQSAYSEEETGEKPIDMSQFNFGNKKPVSIHQSYSMMESNSVTVAQSLNAQKEESIEKRKRMASPKMLRSESVSAYSPKPSAAPSVTSSSKSLRMSVTNSVSSGKGGAAPAPPPAVRMSHAPAPAPSMFAAVESADLFEELTQSPVFKIASFDLSPAPPVAAPALPVREEEEAEEHLLEGISKMSLRNNNTSNKRIISFKARNLNQPQNEKIRFIRRGKSKVPVFEIGESIQFTVGPLDVNNKLEAMIYLSNMPNKTMLEFDGVDSRLTNTLFTQLNKDGQTATLDTKQLKQSKRLIVLSLFIKMHAHDSQKSQVAIVNKPILLVPKGTMSK